MKAFQPLNTFYCFCQQRVRKYDLHFSEHLNPICLIFYRTNIRGLFNVFLSKFPTSTEDYHPHFTDEEWEVKELPKGHTANMCWNTYLPTSLTYNKFLKILWIQAFSSSARNSLKCHSLALFRVWPQNLALPAPQGFRKLQSLNLQAASCLSKGERIMPAVACSRPGLIKVNLWRQRL